MVQLFYQVADIWHSIFNPLVFSITKSGFLVLFFFSVSSNHPRQKKNTNVKKDDVYRSISHPDRTGTKLSKTYKEKTYCLSSYCKKVKK